jgi:hypothetical protein
MFMKVDLPGREADLELNLGRAYPGKKSTQQSGGDYSEATTKSSQRWSGRGAVCAKSISLSFRSQLYRRGILLPQAAKQQIPRAIIPRFGMTILRGFFKLHHDQGSEGKRAGRPSSIKEEGRQGGGL